MFKDLHINTIIKLSYYLDHLHNFIIRLVYYISKIILIHIIPLRYDLHETMPNMNLFTQQHTNNKFH